LDEDLKFENSLYSGVQMKGAGFDSWTCHQPGDLRQLALSHHASVSLCIKKG